LIAIVDQDDLMAPSGQWSAVNQEQPHDSESTIKERTHQLSTSRWFSM
jgi:hypothetical protein